ncbi:MAG: dihydroorotate dehydrogenase-like protein [Bacteroidales bacterium]
MANLETTYLGFKLKNPIIAASSGLTDNIDSIKDFEQKGVSAIVLKSIFEEEILIQMEKEQAAMNRQSFIYPETVDFYEDLASDDAFTEHLKLISDAKKSVSIPVIASVNCVSANQWTNYAQNLQDAGADALELNVFIMPSDFNKTCDENEKVYFKIIDEIKKTINIPVSLKISFYSSNLGALIQQLSHSGIEGLVLFNRFYSPDIDINNKVIRPSYVLSEPSEIAMSLRWIGIMADRAECDLAASTGIHDGEAVIKQLLAGAKAVQIASTVYKNGKGVIEEMLKDVNDWMDKMGHSDIEDFRGKLSQLKTENPAVYYRSQFMKYFAGINNH